MQKTNSKKQLVLVMTIIILLACMIMLLPIATVKAESVTKKLGNVNYDGKTYYCHYNVNLVGDSINDLNGITASRNNLKVVMSGVYCHRNIFTTFKYMINFELYISTNDKPIATKYVEFKIDDKDQVTNPNVLNANTEVTIFAAVWFSIYGARDYTVKWSGTIKSNADAAVNGAKSFRVI